MAEDKAVQLASKVVSEGAVYSIALALLIAETDRRRRDDLVKKGKEAEEKAGIQALHEQHLKAEVVRTSGFSALSMHSRLPQCTLLVYIPMLDRCTLVQDLRQQQLELKDILRHIDERLHRLEADVSSAPPPEQSHDKNLPTTLCNSTTVLSIPYRYETLFVAPVNY